MASAFSLSGSTSGGSGRGSASRLPDLAWLCAAALLAASPPASPAEPLSPAKFLPLTASMVRVEVQRAGGGLSIGTGVTIAPTIIVTNCHVTRDAVEIRVAGQGRGWDVDAQSADAEHDVCFLRAPNWPGVPVPIDPSDGLKVRQQVVALGHTGGAAISFRLGHVRALHSLDDAHVIESDTAFTSGASGGGLFDSNGALVGLLTFRLRGMGPHYFSVPARWIRDKISGESQWASVGPSRGTLAFWQRDADALPYFMRVAPLDLEGRWTELLELTKRWSISAPQDAEPLLVRGRTLQKLDQPQAAVVAFTDALRLRPDDAAAWYGLALAYASSGDESALRGAAAKLASLDEALAEQLSEKLRSAHTVH